MAAACVIMQAGRQYMLNQTRSLKSMSQDTRRKMHVYTQSLPGAVGLYRKASMLALNALNHESNPPKKPFLWLLMIYRTTEEYICKRFLPFILTTSMHVFRLQTFAGHGNLCAKQIAPKCVRNTAAITYSDVGGEGERGGEGQPLCAASDAAL